MAVAFKDQTALTLTLTIGQDVSGGVALIKYQSPDGVTGSWAATTGASTEYQISKALSTGQIDQDGTWVFWSYATFADGTVAPGEPVAQAFKVEGYTP